MRHFRPAGQHVVFESFEDQVLIVRADTGAYFSLDGSAAAVWGQLLAGHDESAIITTVQAQYPDSGDEAPATVRAFLDRLLDEGLVEKGAIDSPIPYVPPALGGEWRPPIVEAYNDMKDLLLFDPIHEVGPEGWPQAADDRG